MFITDSPKKEVCSEQTSLIGSAPVVATASAPVATTATSPVKTISNAATPAPSPPAAAKQPPASPNPKGKADHPEKPVLQERDIFEFEGDNELDGILIKRKRTMMPAPSPPAVKATSAPPNPTPGSATPRTTNGKASEEDEVRKAIEASKKDFDDDALQQAIAASLAEASSGSPPTRQHTVPPHRLPLRDTDYVLHSLVSHSGMLNTGHYVSYARDSKDDTWYKYNDTVITKVTAEEVLGVREQARGYLFFYVKADSVQ